MKTGWKIVLAVVCILLILMALLMCMSPVLTYVLNHHGERLIGRQMRVEKVMINPLVGSVEVSDFHMLEQNEQTDFVAFERLYVRLNYAALMTKTVDVRRLDLENFTGQVLNGDTCFNFSDILARFASDDEAEQDTTSSSWAVELNHIHLINGHLVYRDVPRSKQWSIDNINLNVPGLYLGSHRQSNAGLVFDLPTGGSVRVTAGYVMASRRYAMTLTLEEVDTEVLHPIIEDIEAINTLCAKISGSVHVDGGLDNIKDIVADIDLTIKGLDLGETITFEEYKIKDFHYLIESLNLTGNRVSLNKPSTLKLKALAHGAKLDATYQGMLDPTVGNNSLSLKITGVQMTDFSPITEALMAYPIENGVLAMESKNSIVGGQLVGDNYITINNMEVGRKQRFSRAPYKNIPLKAGVGLLRSASGVILLDLPVSGDVRSPQFSYRKVIRRALLKVFFGPLMGVKDRDKLISDDELEELRELMGEDTATQAEAGDDLSERQTSQVPQDSASVSPK